MRVERLDGEQLHDDWLDGDRSDADLLEGASPYPEDGDVWVSLLVANRGDSPVTVTDIAPLADGVRVVVMAPGALPVPPGETAPLQLRLDVDCDRPAPGQRPELRAWAAAAGPRASGVHLELPGPATWEGLVGGHCRGIPGAQPGVSYAGLARATSRDAVAFRLRISGPPAVPVTVRAVRVGGVLRTGSTTRLMPLVLPAGGVARTLTVEAWLPSCEALGPKPVETTTTVYYAIGSGRRQVVAQPLRAALGSRFEAEVLRPLRKECTAER